MTESYNETGRSAVLATQAEIGRRRMLALARRCPERREAILRTLAAFDRRDAGDSSLEAIGATHDRMADALWDAAFNRDDLR
ncbi:MAG: hypothetical protein OXH59_16295 [Rhodospirillaceae bacterium]|nr:hypothetical protein [Rhodospirillaceae bacterium]